MTVRMRIFITMATALFKYALLKDGDPGHFPPTRITPSVDTIAPTSARKDHSSLDIITPQDDAEAPKNIITASSQNGIRIIKAVRGFTS
jgi:hypothetical protein